MSMCESKVLIERSGKPEPELLMEDVVRVEVEGDDIKVMGILGETRHVRGSIKEINLLKNTILINE